MIIAAQKKKENIAEYILYMWQIQALIRSLDFDLAAIDTAIIANFEVDDKTRKEIKAWYQGLIDEMKKDGSGGKGYLPEITALLEELSLLHNSLLSIYQDQPYMDLYNDASHDIIEFRSKSNNNEMGDVESCLLALYGLLSLRMNNKEISEPTMNAMGKFSKLLSLLSKKYKAMKQGRLELPYSLKN